jgi:hypothetical protein
LAGETMPTLTLFSTGISISAQPELNVPMTPMMSLAWAYARALAEHVAESHLPAWAVASSHDWYWTVYLPAL